MEIIFNNLQENLVYHANIFNYDKTYFNNLITKGLKLDFSSYSLEKDDNIVPTINFLKLKAKEQISQLNTLLTEEDEDEEDEDNNQGMQEAPIRASKDAKTSIRIILEMMLFSFEKFCQEAEKQNQLDPSAAEGDYTGTVHEDNLACCLLYLDGISMVNLDLIKPIINTCPLTGKKFQELLSSIINEDLIKKNIYIKEIASHLMSMTLMTIEDDVKDECIELMNWTLNHYMANKRDNCFTSNLSLILTVDSSLEYFTTTFNEDKQCIRQLFELMLIDSNINTIYEALFCLWNISNNKQYLSIFEKKNDKSIDKIVQVIRTNKIDKVARIGLMTIKNLLDSQTCLENLFNIKFMRTINILLTNKWNDPVIKELLNYIYDFLEKNYKIMNSFDKYVKELENGILKPGSLHTTEFWEENYKEFETGSFEYIRRLVRIIQNQSGDNDIEMKGIACFDLGEFARLYPGGASILDYFGAKDSLLGLIQHKNLELKNRALVCLQKIMMRSLKK